MILQKTAYEAKRINDVKEFRIPKPDLIIHIDMEPSRTKFKQIFENPNFPPIFPTEINLIPEGNVIFGLYVWSA